MPESQKEISSLAAISILISVPDSHRISQCHRRPQAFPDGGINQHSSACIRDSPSEPL